MGCGIADLRRRHSSFIKPLVYSLLKGRTVVIYGSSESEMCAFFYLLSALLMLPFCRIVRSYVMALSMFVPGHTQISTVRRHSHSRLC